ncbi:unnamed protein product, partial [marine sediment metagenome]
FKGFHTVFYVNICQGDVDCHGAWFDEKIYYEFSPTSVLYQQILYPISDPGSQLSFST